MMLMWIIPVVLLIFLLDRPQPERSTRSWALLLLALLALPLIGMAFTGGWMHGYGGGWSWNGWNLAGGIVMLVGLGALGYAALRRGSAEADSEELRILKLRLAKGEISPEEYDLLRQKLNG